MSDWMIYIGSIFLVSGTIYLIALIENKRNSTNSSLMFIFEGIIILILGFIISLYLEKATAKNWIHILSITIPTILFVIVYYSVNSIKNFKIIQQQIIENKNSLAKLDELKEDWKNLLTVQAINNQKEISFLLTNIKESNKKLSYHIEDIEYNIKNLRYSENWHNKIKSSELNKNIWKHIATKYFEIQRGYLRDENKIITSLDYYPSITKQLFEKYKNQKTSKFEIISTMLPQHYFNFPIKKICDEKTKQISQKCKKIDFVNTYRKDIANLVKNIKETKNTMTFKRYTLLVNSEEESVYNGLFSIGEFNKSKKIFLERDKNNHEEFIDDNNVYRENSISSCSSDITPYKYFTDELHSEKAIIKLIEENEIGGKLNNFNFLRIEHTVYKKSSIIYIVAEISISKNLVSLEIIDNSSTKRFIELEDNYKHIKTRNNYNT